MFQGEFQGGMTSLVSLTAIIGPLLMTNLFSYFTSENSFYYFPRNNSHLWFNINLQGHGYLEYDGITNHVPMMPIFTLEFKFFEILNPAVVARPYFAEFPWSW